MAEGDTFGSGLDPSAASFGQGPSPMMGGDAGPDAPSGASGPGPSQPSMFGSGFGQPRYTAPDPQATALDQSADLLQQRIQRAGAVATNPIAQFFNPEGVQKARDFVPAATEMLQKIRQQRAAIQAGHQQAETLGLAPGEVPDEATQADRVEVAKNRALKGDLKAFKGLMAVDPKAAESIQDQVHETVASHLTNAQFAFDSLAGMTNQGQYDAKLRELRQKGTLSDLEAIGLKVPPTFDAFGAVKAREGQALREARIGIDSIRQKLEDRNTYQPMEKKEAETYNGRMTTVYGDQITNGTWGRNAAAGTRGLIVNGASDPRDLGKSFTLATPEQRKAVEEESDKTVPKEEREKYRAFNRTYQLATTDAKGNPVPPEELNTNPNVQQGVAEGLASMLRGGSGGANIGLLKIETSKRGFIQGLIDKVNTEKAAVINELKGKDVSPYLSRLTQKEMRDVMDVLKQYNDASITDRVSKIAERAGALGLDAASIGYGDKETAGAINDAIERGRQAQIARMMPYHQAIGGGDGVFQIGAQRPGAGATNAPPGTAPTTQLPGAQPLATPVQQSRTSPAPSAPSPGGGAPPSSPNQSGTPPAPGGSGPAAPVTVAGQQVTPNPPPGVSPNFVPNMQRIESGNEKDPWTATTKGSSASGAFQMIDSTWAANKPPGAPARAKDATPAQQVAANDKFMAANATALQGAGLPVNDSTMYVAHNLGAGGAAALLRAAPNADARSLVGEKAARNNPLFFRGKPTVATVLARYEAQMNGSLAPAAGGTQEAKAEQPKGFMDRVRAVLNAGAAPEGSPNPSDASLSPEERAAATQAAAGAAPAALSTVGAVAGGAAAGPPGAVAGGAAGGGAGQMLKDYLRGNAQSAGEIAKQTALGGVLGVAPAGRPFVGAAARAAGVGGVEAGAKAAEGGDAADIAEAGAGGLAAAAGGEAFGRALGMVGHKVFSMFSPNAQKAVQEAAAKFSQAEETLAKETPKLPGVGGAAGGPNPKYVAAERAKAEAETVLKDAGLKPEEAAYAHKVSDTSKGDALPGKQEAQAAKPGELEKQRLGEEYKGLEQEVKEYDIWGRLKPPGASPKLTDGPIAAVESKAVSAKHAELAQRTEMAITAPAKSWQEKWVQLKDARSALLEAERDALTSTAPGRTQTAKDMRKLADTVRVQQEKAAKYVFGEKDGEAFMGRLKVLDTRYRNLMEATNGGDLAGAARMTGEAGREADRKFRAFAHDDPTALAAWAAMRATKSNVEKDVRTLVGAEKIPYLGKVISVAKMLGSFREWMQERTAGSPAKFEDFVKLYDDSGRRIRDLTGTAGARAATMGQ